MAAQKPNGITLPKWVGLLLPMVVFVLSIGGFWVSIRADMAVADSRLTRVEEDVKEIKADVKSLIRSGGG